MSAYNYQRKERGALTSHDRRILRNLQEGQAVGEVQQRVTRAFYSDIRGTHDRISQLLTRVQDGRTISPF